MRAKLVFSSTILALSLGFSLPAGAFSFGSSSSSASSKIISFIALVAGKDKICRQGDVKKGIFSVRSFSGVGCSTELLGSFALKFCKDYPGFAGSGCYRNAMSAMKGENPEKVLGDKLIEAPPADKKALCDEIDPDDMTPKQARACEAA